MPREDALALAAARSAAVSPPPVAAAGCSTLGRLSSLQSLLWKEDAVKSREKATLARLEGATRDALAALLASCPQLRSLDVHGTAFDAPLVKPDGTTPLGDADLGRWLALGSDRVGERLAEARVLRCAGDKPPLRWGARADQAETPQAQRMQTADIAHLLESLLETAGDAPAEEGQSAVHID